MPVVRYQRQIGIGAAPTPQQDHLPIGQLQTPPPRVAPPAESYGAEFGEAVARIGTGLQAQEIARQDLVRITQAERKLSDWELDRIYHPEHGALNVQGEGVYGLPDKLGEDYDKTAGDIASGLNERQRARFSPVIQARRSSMLARVDSHVAQQSRLIDGNETKTYLANETSIAVSNVDDPHRVGLAIGNIRRQVGLYGARNGWGPEQTKEAIDDAVSGVHVGVVDRFLALGQDIQAEVYFEHAKDEIRGQEIAQVEKALEEGSLRGQSQRQADTLWQVHAGATLSQLLDEAKKIKDPKLRERVEQRLSSRWSVQKQDEQMEERDRAAAAKQAIDDGMQAAMNAIDRGIPRDMVQVHQLVDQVAPDLWAQLDGPHRAELDRYAQQLFTNDRPTEQEHFYRITQQATWDPDAFMRRDLFLSLSKLSNSDFQQLAMLQNMMQENRRKEAQVIVDDYRTSDQVINNALREFNIDPSPKEGTPESKAIARLRQMAGEAALAWQRENGKKQTPNDVLQKIVDDLLQQDVTVPGSWWGLWPGSGQSVFDQNKRIIDLTIADVPAAERTKIEDALSGAGRPITDDAILTLYVRTQERLRNANRNTRPRVVPAPSGRTPTKPADFARPTRGN